MGWLVMRRPAPMLCLAASMTGCGGVTHVETVDTGTTLADVRIDVLGERDFTAPAPLPTPDPTIALPEVLVDSTQGPRYSFPVTVRTADLCDAMLLLPEGASRYVGFRTPNASATTQVWSVSPRRLAGATPRSARMQVAIACGGKISRPVTVPVPFF
jgi:hypothetical protein